MEGRTFDESAEEEEILSEADSDYLDLHTNIAKFEDTVRKFIHQQNHASNDEYEDAHGHTRSGKRMHGNKGRVVLRGPRKAAEPTGDIRARMGRASQAFIQENYEEAKALVEEVIRINAETHEAWTLLASIFKELGDMDKTLLALIYAAHLRPKDVAQWLSVASFALEETGEQRAKNLPSAKFCFSSAIRANPKDDFEARCGKAAVLREMGSTSAAIAEYRHILKQRPHDTSILRLVAEAYIDKDNVRSAQELYRKTIAFYKDTDEAPGAHFTWSDANIYVELYAYAGDYVEAIKELRSLSRWLLGRKLEYFWDETLDSDMEWDSTDDRRVLNSRFIPGRYSHMQYGDGLPMELRVKLGLYRLKLGFHDEGIAHIARLDPENKSFQDLVLDYPDLYRDAADGLQEAEFYEYAISFYQALRKNSNPNDPSLLIEMGKCFLKVNRNREAEESFEAAINVDPDNIESRIHLARMYESLDEQEQAFIYVNEVLNLRRSQNSKKKLHRSNYDASTENDTLMPAVGGRKSYYKPKRLVNAEERQRQEAAIAERLQEQFSVMRLERNGMRAGDARASGAWMAAAADLIEDFRGFKTFYPWDKYVRFMGYTAGAARDQPQTGATPLDADLAEMANRISTRLGAEVDSRNDVTANVPENYRGISFATWLDIFLDYALCLVRYGRHQEAYEICEAAKDAIVFYHCREDMFLIHVCWCACAVLANDEETCVAACRYFMKDYQFTTDTYRMFAALNRLCQSPISWYSSGPTQKYILRQIKAMDYGLVNEDARRKYFSEKGSYSAQDESGRLIVNKEMDVALLMVYGHILYTGTSYTYALNYFFRAHALDPDNPMINLSIGLGYVHYGMKRQAENRQFHIMQGLSFLFKYYKTRRQSPHTEERKEASYNLGRTYHMLGLTHLAVPYYEEVLDDSQSSLRQEDLALDAAFNLQTIYNTGGNWRMAQSITNSWLII